MISGCFSGLFTWTDIFVTGSKQLGAVQFGEDAASFARERDVDRQEDDRNRRAVGFGHGGSEYMAPAPDGHSNTPGLLVKRP